MKNLPLSNANHRPAVALLAAVAVSAVLLGEVRAQTPAIDSTATRILKQTTDYIGGDFYRAVFQGNTLVYVTAEPK